MAEKRKLKELHLSEIMGFSKYIYLFMLLLCIGVVLYMMLPGIISTPSTFENVVMGPYIKDGTVFVGAMLEEGGAASELTAEETLNILESNANKRVRLISSGDTKGEAVLSVLTINKDGKDKKPAPVLRLTFTENYCVSEDLDVGGGNTVRFR